MPDWSYITYTTSNTTGNSQTYTYNYNPIYSRIFNPHFRNPTLLKGRKRWAISNGRNGLDLDCIDRFIEWYIQLRPTGLKIEYLPHLCDETRVVGDDYV